jgi:hypothetical protein
VNGDGYSDVIVGAWSFTNGHADEGRAFVYHGSFSGLASSPAWTAESDQAGAFFGRRVAGAGDVNGDGFSDVIIGAELYDAPLNAEGRAYVYHGSPGGLSLTPAWTAEGDLNVALFGSSVATAGDVNGDGFSDVIVGAKQVANPEFEEGRVSVYHGSAGGLSAAPNWTAESNRGSAFLGECGTAGDVNGDGFSDVIVAAPDYVSLPNVGRAWIYGGSADGLAATPLWLGQSHDRFGWQVATAGDVNGDGFSDVLVGAHNSLNGRVYFFFGNHGDGLDRIPQQARVFDSNVAVQVLGLSDAERSIRIRALGRTPIGRGRVRLEWELEPFGTPLDGSVIRQGQFMDTGAPGPNGSAVNVGRHPGDLEPGTLYHWRLRVSTDSPFFPRSPWLSIPDNALSEADIRTAFEGTTAVDETPASAPPLGLIERNVPNPFSSDTEIAYTLPQAARHRLAVYDVLGRQVTLLAEGIQPAGRHMLRWDGSDLQGHRLPAGIYFLRLDLAGRVESRKVVLTN